MANIKLKDVTQKNIKTLTREVKQPKRIKDSIEKIKEKPEESVTPDSNINEYGSNKIELVTNKGLKKTINQFNKQGKKSLIKTKDNLREAKNNVRFQKAGKYTIKNSKNTIKTSQNIIKNKEKVAKESLKISRKAAKIAREASKEAVRTTRRVVKVTISAIKGIIAAVKSLISALMAVGGLAMVIIIIICLIGLLFSSVFGIFFSGEKTDSNVITMKDVIAECNQEFSDKIQSIQDKNVHDDYVLDGNMATWKDILIIYAIDQANGLDGQEVMIMNESKKQIFKKIFWEMNSLSSNVKKEKVTEQGININEMPKEVEKRVLHIIINSKTADEIKGEYQFSPMQIKLYNELSSNKYDSLWSGIIYGLNNTGDFLKWRQGGQSWSNIRIGNTTATIADIGCLVTSIAIQIERSGANTTIVPFNPGTFVEALNSNNAFDENGNLSYNQINKVVPNFKYAGNINLRGKNRTEKLELIKQHLDLGYYLTIEVAGATPGNQHWVAILGVDGNNINIVDPASDKTDLWSAYEWSKTTQFNYFKAD